MIRHGLRASKLALSVSFIAFLLSACVSHQGLKEPGQKYWLAEGKLGLIYEQQKSNANFSWQNQDDNFNIALFGPLGQGRVELEKRRGLHTLRDKNGSSQAQSAEALLA